MYVYGIKEIGSGLCSIYETVREILKFKVTRT